MRTAFLMAIAAIATATTAVAADGASESSSPFAVRDRPLTFEVAAFGAVVVGGHFRSPDAAVVTTGTGTTVSLSDHGAFAVTADLRADEGSQYELFYSREPTGLQGTTLTVPRAHVTVEYLHLGGTVLLDDQPALKPYAVGGLGATRFTPDQVGNTDTRFSVSLGLGLRWPVTRHFSVRVEGKGLVTFMDPNTAVFCRSNQSGLLCNVHGDGRAFVQGEFLAGAAYAF